MSYLRVCDDVNSTPVELESEEDDTLLVSTLQAQFPNAIGLRYLPDPNTDIYRGIRCVDGKLKPPKDGWEGITLYCTYPPEFKRKNQEEVEDEPNAKKSCTPREVKCSDLIVLGLSFSTTDESLKKYFEDKFGPLLMALVKTDLHSKRSKGFGFIRFLKYEDQVKALSARKHEIDGRWVTIKPPYAKEGVESSLPSKVFISRLTPEMTSSDLTEYFSKYGEVADVFFPNTPFRGFAFLTFLFPEAADQACNEQPHIIKNVSISVVQATDQQKKPSFHDDRRGRGGYGGGRGGYGGYERFSSRDRGNFGGSSRYSRGKFSNSGGRDSYRSGYDSYDRDYNYGPSPDKNGPGANDIGKILAAALNDPDTISNLLSNLGGSSKSSMGGAPPSSRSMDYQPSRDYNSSADYKDYSYSDYNNQYSNSNDKGYSKSPSKYGGGGSSSLRY